MSSCKLSSSSSIKPLATVSAASCFRIICHPFIQKRRTQKIKKATSLHSYDIRVYLFLFISHRYVYKTCFVAFENNFFCIRSRWRFDENPHWFDASLNVFWKNSNTTGQVWGNRRNEKLFLEALKAKSVAKVFPDNNNSDCFRRPMSMSLFSFNRKQEEKFIFIWKKWKQNRNML